MPRIVALDDKALANLPANCSVIRFNDTAPLCRPSELWHPDRVRSVFILLIMSRNKLRPDIDRLTPSARCSKIVTSANLPHKEALEFRRLYPELWKTAVWGETENEREAEKEIEAKMIHLIEHLKQQGMPQDTP
jgi:hypothetical protein